MPRGRSTSKTRSTTTRAVKASQKKKVQKKTVAKKSTKKARSTTRASSVKKQIKKKSTTKRAASKVSPPSWFRRLRRPRPRPPNRNLLRDQPLRKKFQILLKAGKRDLLRKKELQKRSPLLSPMRPFSEKSTSRSRKSSDWALSCKSKLLSKPIQLPILTRLWTKLQSGSREERQRSRQRRVKSKNLNKTKKTN